MTTGAARSVETEERFALAGRWLFTLQTEDVSHEEFSNWLQWYEQDPLNRAAFEEAQALFEAARGISVEERRDWAGALLASARVRGARPREVDTSPMPMRKGWLGWRGTWLAPRQWAAAAAVFASLAIALSAWLTGVMEPGPQLTTTFQTPLATHRSEALPDGSVVHLGARSSISVNFSSETRYVVLEAGEALFTVAKDSSRPFVVQAGQVAIRAIGTEFNVRRAAESTAIAVGEGVVEIVRGTSRDGSPTSRTTGVRVSAGEQLVIETDWTPPTAKPIELAAVAAWQSGRLEFENATLRVVVATVNRYSPREIVITDPRLNDLRITGTVDGRQTNEWLSELPEIIPVRVIEVSKGTVLISPSPRT
jgi:transmembrane sensor